MKFRITDEKGLLVGGEIKPKGEIIEASGPQMDAWLHFQQIEPEDSEAKELVRSKAEFEGKTPPEEADEKPKRGRRKKSEGADDSSDTSEESPE